MTLRHEIAHDGLTLAASSCSSGVALLIVLPRLVLSTVIIITISSPDPQSFSIPFLAVILLRSYMDHTAPCTCSFCFAPQLISVSLDVIQSICNDNIVPRHRSLDRRELCRACCFFLSCTVVYLISQRAYVFTVALVVLRCICRRVI